MPGESDNDHDHNVMIMTLLMSEHSLRGRPEAAGGGQPQAAAGQHGRDPAQPRGDGGQVRQLSTFHNSYQGWEDCNDSLCF